MSDQIKLFLKELNSQTIAPMKVIAKFLAKKYGLAFRIESIEESLNEEITVSLKLVFSKKEEEQK